MEIRMALTEPSSVVFSIQQLLHAETERVAAKKEESETELKRSRELRGQEVERERQRYERQAVLEREEQQSKTRLLEAEGIKNRLEKSNAVELERLRRAIEQEYEAKYASSTERIHALAGRHRILLSALATGLVGAVLFWLIVVLPGQHRANESYSALNSLYESSLKERRGMEESFRLERQQLRRQLNALLEQTRTGPSVSETVLKPVGQKPKPVRPESKPPCTCLTGDPLCAC